MSDSISRQATIDLIRSMESDATSHGISPRLTPSHVINGIESLPSANRPTGKWVIHNHGVTFWYKCDQCGEAGDKEDRYCKHCGAKMKV